MRVYVLREGLADRPLAGGGGGACSAAGEGNAIGGGIDTASIEVPGVPPVATDIGTPGRGSGVPGRRADAIRRGNRLVPT